MKLSRLIEGGLLIPIFFLILISSARAQSRALITQQIQSDRLVALKGNTHPLAQARFDQGRAPDALTLKSMLLVLKRDEGTEKALQSQIDAMHAPNSAQYHKWLTPAEFRERFGASSEDVNKITSWLTSQGFSVKGLSAGGTVLEFSGTAGAVRSAFHTEIHRFRVNGEDHWANASDPRIPAALLPAIAGTVSLHNFERKPLHQLLGLMHYDKASHTWVKKDQGISLSTAQASSRQASGVHSLYTVTDVKGNTFEAVGPGDFATIYNLQPLWDAGIDGTGQEVAIIGRSAITTTDVDRFRAAFGLPATKLKIVAAGDMPTKTSSEGESLLDIQWSGAVAKNATIDYVVAASTDTTDGVDLASMYAVDNDVAPVISVSYGQCELGLGVAGNTFYNNLWQQAVAEGITVMVSTGDAGAATCDQGYSTADYGNTVNGLASTPYNVAVGGTDFNDFGGPNGVTHSQYWNTTNDTVTRGSALSYIPEMVWNDSCGNDQIYKLLGFPDGESLCNSDTAFADGLINTASGGGGVSSCTISSNLDSNTCDGGYDKPAWQNTAGVPDDGKRDLPDVSLFAADGIAGSFYLFCQSSATPSGTCNYNDSTDIDFMGAGGTSFASPAFAGMMALVNQKTGQRQGNANYILYSMARSQFGTMSDPNLSAMGSCSADLGNGVGSSCVFHDVVSGNNAVPCANGTPNCSINVASDSTGVTSGYSATTGFDPATGLGSVDTTNMVNTWSQAVQQLLPSTTALTLSPTTGTYGTSISYTVTVAPASGSGVPSGSGVFLANNQSVGSFTLSNGSASGTLTGLPAGQYTVTAQYASDGIYGRSSSSAVALNLSKANSSTALVLSEQNPFTGTTTATNTIHYGARIVASAAVTGISGLASPTGTMQFNSTGSDSQASALDAAGKASVTLSGLLAVGATETITAVYAGDTDYSGRTSSAQALSIVKAASSIRISSSSPYLLGSGNLTITASLYSYSLGASPTGSLNLSINGTKVAAVAGSSGADIITGAPGLTAQFTVASSALQTGANQISVSYDGDSNYSAASSPALTVDFGASSGSSSVDLSTSSTAAGTQETVALTATVKVDGAAAPAGSVTFSEGAKVLGTAQVVRLSGANSNVAGTATVYLRLPAGTHAITATYSGISTAIPSAASNPLSVSVTGTQPSSLALSATQNPLHNANYDFTATFWGYGYGVPTGAVSVEETSTVASLASGTFDASTSKISYDTQKTFVLDNSVEFLATGDLNRDGIADVILRKIGSLNNVLEVYLGKGGGAYADPVEYPVGSASRGHQIIVSDLNGDGFLDIATVNQLDNSVSILLGNGDGSLQAAYAVAVQQGPISLRCADVNRDGIADLLTFSVAAGNVSVLFGNGDGSFQPPVTSAIGVLPQTPEIGDLNGDGYLDVAYTDLVDYPSMLYVSLGKPDGTFAGSQSFPLTDQAYVDSLHLADLNSDGKLDAVLSDSYSGTVLVLNGDGKGNFGTATSYIAGIQQPIIHNALPVDIDGDGHLDIVAADGVNSTVNLLMNKGDGTFSSPTGFFPTLILVSEIYAADMNGDGMPDLLQTSQLHGDNGAVLLIGATKATTKFRNTTTYGPAGQLQQGIATFDGDSNFASATSTGVTFYGSGQKATPKIVWTPAATTWGNGAALGSGILDAAASGGIPGTFTYTAQLSGGTATAVTPASALTSDGSYVLTATFTPSSTDSYTTATAQVSLAITDPDFAVSVPASDALTVSSGGTVKTSITVDPLYGFGGFVSFTCSSPAVGVSCVVSPTSVAPGGTATVTIAASSSSNATASLPSFSLPLARRLAAGGVVVSCLLLLVMPRQRKIRKVLGVLLVFVSVGSFWGCGGSSPAQSSTLVLSSANAHVSSGETVTLSASLTTTKSRALTGNITFYDGTTQLGSAAVGNNGATYTTNKLGVGIHTLSAKYEGDVHALASTSNSLMQVVAGTTTVTVTGTYGAQSHVSTMNLTIQ